MARPKLTDVPGIGEATADLLAASGIRGAKTLAGASSEKLAAVRGFGPARAAAVQKAAKGLLGSSEPAKQPSAKATPKKKAAEKTDAGGKGKGKGKGKPDKKDRKKKGKKGKRK